MSNQPVKNNLQLIKERIQDICANLNRNPEEIKIIAVTKYVSIDRAKEALEAGIVHLGENRDEGLLEKWEEIGEDATWHFIGSLQSKKVKNVINHVGYIHSLDRISLAKELHKRTEDTIKCFVQVNASEEASKHGLAQEEVIEFIEKLKHYPKIEVVGLMTMAPHTEDESVIRGCFKQLRMLKDQIQDMNLPYAPCEELSMGMSNDYHIAIEEGATFIRIGSSLVGNEQ
ncbi:hypothetical protein FIU87_09050 [Bacillus sp. THAF10]|uniref:YggS family pyridoxal phosphate-dependent enzyme n=1 Tax=Bacillus sp. THAF10 TaxID=2587848 RepID=UPI0012692FD4|nr:YggS family pyridoxal phosphate-dependent enzyme [Bacillus sp. THAF10]QFT88791.1 hypothetical protein FIU87_09050 [Bacillus sp. THAF10]